MPQEFPDRSDRLFGREKDLAALAARVRCKGLTAVVARPQMGKSWLLTELARRLSLTHEPLHLVGFAEQVGQTPDLLVRAVADLYTRWLSDAGMAEQAGMVLKQQRDRLLPGVAGTLGKFFSEVFGNAAKPVTVVVDEAIKGLVAANETLTSGGLKLPVLQYEQARDLVTVVAHLSGRPIALFLDQWERSTDATMESRTLDAFLRHLDDWPACHLFLALRPDEPAYGVIEALARSMPGTAHVYPLDLMNLAEARDSDGLLSFLRWRVPAARGVAEATLLAAIDGYPGVISQWTSDYQREAMHSTADLERVAADAHEFRFSELDTLLPRLKGGARRLAARVVLLPLAAEPGIWDEIKADVLDGIDANALDDLHIARVLESSEPPSFGHAKRWEAARGWFIENRRNAARQEAEALVLTFASRIGDISAEMIAPTLALSSLREISQDLSISVLHRALCEAAVTLFEQGTDAELILDGARAAKTTPGAARLLAMGLFNTLIDAKAEDDLPRRDALLDELRKLAKRYPADASLREQLAMGLLNTLTFTNEEDDLLRRDALLDEMCKLAERYPDDAGVRERLAKGLFNTLIDAKAEDDLSRRDALLDELRKLAERYPDDASVREQLAKALLNTLNQAKVEDDLPRRDALLDKLRKLAECHPDDASVREPLAMGLFNTLNDVKAEDDLSRRDALLDELRKLAGRYPDDASVREQLAIGLLNTLNQAKAEGNLPRRDALLDEQRRLAERCPDDARVREPFAMGLFSALLQSAQEGNAGRFERLRDELHGLASDFPEDAFLQTVIGALPIDDG